MQVAEEPQPKAPPTVQAVTAPRQEVKDAAPQPSAKAPATAQPQASNDVSLSPKSDLSALVSRHESIRKLGTAAFADFPKPTSVAYMPNMSKGKMHEKDIADDNATHQHWSKLHVVLPQYQTAAATICVDPTLMGTTVLMRHLRDADNLFATELDRFKQAGRAGFEKALLYTIQVAYKLDAGAARKQADVVCGQNIFDKVSMVYGNLEPWKQPYFAHAIKLLGEVETDKGAMIAKLSEVCDRALHCPHVQIKSFGLLVGHSYRLILLDGKKGNDAEQPQYESYGMALRRFFEFFEDFLDDHKEHAFNAAFMQPARFFWKCYGDDLGLNNVDTHGANWYIAMLNSALSVHVPIMATYWDGCERMVVDYWAGFKEEVWQAFHEPSHFGNSFEGIPKLRAGKGLCLSSRPGNGQMPNGHGGQGHEQSFFFANGIGKPKWFANTVVNPEWCKRNEKFSKQIALYLERFAYFFSREFFIRKAFEVLYAEFKPDHVGFRKACEVLFNVYRAEQGITEESIVEHVYKDDSYSDLDIDRTEKFFVWTGVLKPSSTCVIKPGNSDASEKQIVVDKEMPPAGKEDDASDNLQTALNPQLAKINSKIQQAMKERDTAAVRGLMEERAQLLQQRKQADQQELAEEQEHVTLLRIASNRSKQEMEQIQKQVSGQILNEVDEQPSIEQREKTFGSLAMVSASIHEFIDQYISVFAESMDRPPDFRAAIFERWQWFEMEHNSQPDVILRVAQLVAGNDRYQSTITKALCSKTDCLRDTAGMTLRFYGMWKDGELKLSPTHGAQLEAAFEAIVEPLERQGKPENIPPEHAGALYMQSIMPWICASNNATSTLALARVVQRIARGIDRWWKEYGTSPEFKHRFVKFVVRDYLVPTHRTEEGRQFEAPLIWANATEDLVWQILET